MTLMHLVHALLAVTLFGQPAGAPTTVEITLAHDHYPWVYQTVTARPRDIGTVLRTHRLSLPQ